jgi:two-component system, chemotaxis family, chemotaxis protein CheY
MRILIVDDDQFVRTVLRDILAPTGHQVSEATNGAEALERIRDQVPDLVILDLLMPKMSGMEALKEIRRMEPRSKVVVITSLASDALAEEAMRFGASGFVVKPFHAMEIEEAVRQAMRAEA